MILCQNSTQWTQCHWQHLLSMDLQQWWAWEDMSMLAGAHTGRMLTTFMHLTSCHKSRKSQSLEDGPSHLDDGLN